MRRIAGVLALLSLFASPIAGRTQFFCRFTGAEIRDCAEQRVPERSVLDTQGCCERRTTRAAEPARTSAADPLSAAPLAAAVLPAPIPPPSLAGHQRYDRVAVADGGPPLYLQQRALLIRAAARLRHRPGISRRFPLQKRLR
jgi:hypothetical protein